MMEVNEQHSRLLEVSLRMLKRNEIRQEKWNSAELHKMAYSLPESVLYLAIFLYHVNVTFKSYIIFGYLTPNLL